MERHAFQGDSQSQCVFHAAAVRLPLCITAVGILCIGAAISTDTFSMRISDVFFAFPGLVFAPAVAGSFGGGLHNAIIALAAISTA